LTHRICPFTPNDDDDGGDGDDDDVRENQRSGIQVATLRESAASNNKCQRDVNGRKKKEEDSKKTARDIPTMKTRSKPVPLRFPSNGAHDCPLDAPVHALVLR